MTDAARILINPYNRVRFIDVYGPLVLFGGYVHIGTLAKVNGPYTFDYNVNDYAMTSRTLNGMPAVHNETDNPLNWWFFKKRVPPLQRPDVIKHVEATHLDIKKPLSLLAVFGAQNIRDPRILVARL
jgi:hypothetical protein